jgi:ubiquinone/menaquinone biosynthesis C-methylase UbiE
MFRKRSFDTIASPYAALERMTFGHRLQKARTYALRQIDRPIKRALLLGDGNGSFAIELLSRHPDCQIDSIEISPKMLAISQQRISVTLPGNADRYHPILADALNYDFGNACYDFVGLHFFLDCFEDPECEQLIQATTAALETRGVLSFADFNIPTKQPYRYVGRCLIRLLYLSFRLLTGLKTKRLPQCKWPNSLKQIHAVQTLKGLFQKRVFVKL